MLAEVERLSRVLNQWSQDSEISRHLAQPGEHEVSSDLLTVLRAADHWQQASGGRFNPRVAVFGGVWKQAEERQSLPTQAELEAGQAEAQRPAWVLAKDGSARVRFTGEKDITLSGIAKDYIIDQAGQKAFAALAASSAGADSSLLLNIGGDLRHWGQQPSTASVTHPQAAAENALPASTVTLHDQALATSGGYRRGWHIGGVLHSHVLDPRTGLPAQHTASASVIATDAMTANALAVTLSLMPVQEALALARQQNVHCLLISHDGALHRSPGWPEHTPTVVAAEVSSLQTAATAPPKAELTLSFEFPPQSKRPYIAAYITDKDDFPVRTLLLWIVQGGKRQKWLPDLRQWYKDDKTRRLVDPTDLVETRATATRRAGAYSVVWDGKDDLGQPLPTGKYTLHLEAAREKGTHQEIKYAFDWNGTPFASDLTPNVEITSAKVECAKLD